MGKVRKKCLVIVAHADDEALWCSTLPKRYPEHEWKLVCCSTPAKGPERATKELHESCEVLGYEKMYLARGIIDKGVDTDLDALDQIVAHIYEAEHIFTHNEFGEYGHRHHKQVHNFVRNSIGANRASGSLTPITYFGYTSKKEFDFKARGFSHKLSPDELFVKQQAIGCYKHIEKTRPYYQSIYNWVGKLPHYQMEVENFYGDWP